MTAIVKHNGHWFLDNDGEMIGLSVSNPMFDGIWTGVSMMLDVYDDDCGGNLQKCVENCLHASAMFAGVSQLCLDRATFIQDQIELDRLYAPDDDEPWYQK